MSTESSGRQGFKRTEDDFLFSLNLSGGGELGEESRCRVEPIKYSKLFSE
jgi:hypothetical protein